ncbi:glycosyltransferase family 2 protein [Pedobacter montanisoli]|uniref:Glycosyltransferase n=1 Tax=Pedobacter montanisoli TaxID=2923277 RepID=A0ABS9ZVX8_9SPHI|nr:glycosyltransferase family 2 protein [Pedobacter montanisoli]MCJ0742458.1 glycosyltransferase [Pedobacter montanisoli]
MKITIITVVYNARQYLQYCIESVIEQDYKNIEYILIDGNSTDDSFEIAQQYKEQISILISEPDKGMYDALNKGIEMATGEIVGILNADDMLAGKDVISAVANLFRETNTDGVYGDLNYVDKNNTQRVIRKWKSTSSNPKDLAWGWMPAHPTLYLKRSVFQTFGSYSLTFGSAADYEFMLRLLYKNRINVQYLNKLMVNMRTGGMSNRNMSQRYKAFLNDYKALKHNEVKAAILALMLKKARKIRQFF